MYVLYHTAIRNDILASEESTCFFATFATSIRSLVVASATYLLLVVGENSPSKTLPSIVIP